MRSCWLVGNRGGRNQGHLHRRGNWVLKAHTQQLHSRDEQILLLEALDRIIYCPFSFLLFLSLFISHGKLAMFCFVTLLSTRNHSVAFMGFLDIICCFPFPVLVCKSPFYYRFIIEFEHALYVAVLLSFSLALKWSSRLIYVHAQTWALMTDCDGENLLAILKVYLPI